VTLRDALPGDALKIAQIHIQSWRESYRGIVSDDFLMRMSLQARVQSWQENLSPRYQGPRFNLVAQGPEGQLVGFASGGPQRDWDPQTGRPLAQGRSQGSPRPPGLGHLRDYDGELWAIYILRSHQGKGLGRSLFEAVKARLKRGGCASMLVWVLKENPARAFYERLGAVELGSKPIHIDRDHEEVAYGWKQL
jgi:GNAT superfamily N-acetyltransferase